MKIKLAIFGLCLLSNVVYADSWGAMRWGQNPWGADASPEASYDFGSGLLILKNVDVSGQHYYVELQNQGFGSSFAFALGHVQPLDHAASTYQTVYDGGKGELNIPHVSAGGQYFAVNMKNDNLFIFRLTGNPIAVRMREPDAVIVDDTTEQEPVIETE
ncbi:MAG: hypothetical protein NTV00_00725 [Methylococcales bacterium]|nr:hypothetical protein [Methylococcales bacterium]